MLPLTLITLVLCALLELSIADTNVTVGDAQIPWPTSNPPWSGTNTSCSPSGQAHFAYEASMTLSYPFLGTAIYMQVLRSNVTGVYTVSVDNNTPVNFDGFSSTGLCDIQFGHSGLSLAPHTVTVTLTQQSPQDTRSAGNNFYLEVDGFIVTVPSNTTSIAPPTSTSTSTSTSSTLSTSTSSTPSASALPAAIGSKSSSLHSSAITAIVVGVVLGVVVIAAIAFLLRRRRRNRPQRLELATNNLMSSPHTITPFSIQESESQTPYQSGSSHGRQPSSVALLSSSGIVLSHRPPGSDFSTSDSKAGMSMMSDEPPPDYNSIQ